MKEFGACPKCGTVEVIRDLNGLRCSKCNEKLGNIPTHFTEDYPLEARYKVEKD